MARAPLSLFRVTLTPVFIKRQSLRSRLPIGWPGKARRAPSGLAVVVGEIAFAAACGSPPTRCWRERDSNCRSPRGASLGSDRAAAPIEDRLERGSRLAHVGSPVAMRKPETKSSRYSGFRRKPALGTTTGVRARSRLTISRASSSRPMWA